MKDLLGKANEPRSNPDGGGANASTAGQADGMGDQATYRTLLSLDTAQQGYFRLVCRAGDIPAVPHACMSASAWAIKYLS
ncbi:hypothetical protein ACIQ6K_13790 [Streptomyces sp. NPDC096354]|uniref:hypothetical protein n=1 Tax=Streptomyces sp. NPDC096354 TaxID=3366088 RepID=UPI00380B39B9